MRFSPNIPLANRCRIAALALITAILTAAGAGTAAAQEIKPGLDAAYACPDAGFTIQPPSGWILSATREKAGDAVLHAQFSYEKDPDSGWRKNLSIVSVPSPYMSGETARQTFQQEMGAWQLNMADMLTRAGLSDVVITVKTLDTLPGGRLELVAEIDASDVTFQFYAQIVFAKGRRFEILYITYFNDFLVEVDTYKKSAATFQIKTGILGVDLTHLTKLQWSILVLLLAAAGFGCYYIYRHYVPRDEHPSITL